MFSIGEFSRITDLSVKAIRIYHEKGLLIPVKIDELTGYRYYDGHNVEKARVIQYLKGMEFTLDEIENILGNYEDEAEIIDFLEKQKDAIEAKIKKYKNIKFSIYSIIFKEKEIKMKFEHNTFDVEEKELETVLVAGVRMKGKYCDISKGFKEISGKFGRYISGKAMALYYDTEYKENDADFEACMPIRKGKDQGNISVRELPGGRCISLIHKGPYDELSRSYEKILAYGNMKQYKLEVPSREVYLKGPGMIFKGNPKNYLTEIQILIEE